VILRVKGELVAFYLLCSLRPVPSVCYLRRCGTQVIMRHSGNENC